MAPRIYIVVYKGDPVDLQKTRHTALFIYDDDDNDDDDRGNGDILHVAGAAGLFVFERRHDENPEKSRTFVRQFPVEPIINSPTKQQLITEITATPVNNSTHSWNCQIWIGDALGRLVGAHWISTQTASNAISSMAAVIVEAKDEEP
ncbi:hypothetical protein AYO20_05423 [Fonsecaea nubica]|uniref:Uncharacterized protein n=1 Tax=Fonsecaea nubica TaxID=856822 RepID=A0A178D1K2_9EURO|nr:hypothetical protein AYO20_05423 [Fonsecaea nubica]OAL35372.1 hypothetical protein AYO20_05423 [Fonsecaea nubica]